MPRRYTPLLPLGSAAASAAPVGAPRRPASVFGEGAEHSTRGWGEDFSACFPGMKIANRGISGDTSRGVLIRLQEDVLALHPQAVVLLIGTNDLEEKAEPETIAANLKLLLAELARSKMPI